MTQTPDQSAAQERPAQRPAPLRMVRVLLGGLDFYRRWLSPALHSLSPDGCKFLPTCSEYASVAIATHGPVRGILLALRRLLRCHPFGRGGLDPVPPVPNQPLAQNQPSTPNSSHIPHQPLP